MIATPPPTSPTKSPATDTRARSERAAGARDILKGAAAAPESETGFGAVLAEQLREQQPKDAAGERETCSNEADDSDSPISDPEEKLDSTVVPPSSDPMLSLFAFVAPVATPPTTIQPIADLAAADSGEAAAVTAGLPPTAATDTLPVPTATVPLLTTTPPAPGDIGLSLDLFPTMPGEPSAPPEIVFPATPASATATTATTAPPPMAATADPKGAAATAVAAPAQPEQRLNATTPKLDQDGTGDVFVEALTSPEPKPEAAAPPQEYPADEDQTEGESDPDFNPADGPDAPKAAVSQAADAPAEPAPQAPEPTFVSPQATALPQATPGAGSSPAAPHQPVTVPELASQLSQLAREVLPDRPAEVRLRLDPPSLGEVRVHIETGVKGMQVRIVTESAEARSVLSDAREALRQELERGGLALQSFSVSVGAEGRRQPPTPQPEPVETPRRSPASPTISAALLPAAAAVSNRPRGTLDFRA